MLWAGFGELVRWYPFVSDGSYPSTILDDRKNEADMAKFDAGLKDWHLSGLKVTSSGVERRRCFTPTRVHVKQRISLPPVQNLSTTHLSLTMSSPPPSKCKTPSEAGRNPRQSTRFGMAHERTTIIAALSASSAPKRAR